MEPMTPADILNVALKKEQAAYSFYDRMLGKTKVQMVTELLLKLRDEEGKHIVMIQKLLIALNR